MLIGAHVRTGGSLLGALERGRAIGADVVQVFTQSPRMWKPTRYGPEALAAYREAQAASSSVAATYCHASYLVNLASPDRALLERSRATLVANLTVARGMGASGLVLHAGSHLGRGFESVVGQVADALLAALDAAVDPLAGASPAGVPCPILLENTAGSGGSVGHSFEELAALVERADAGDALGVCLDTQHLWASGVSFGSVAEAGEVVASIDATVGLPAVRCLHLNDSKSPLGARVDRHANLGEGTIGKRALGCLIGHPSLAGRPAIVEVAGAGDGPRPEDVTGARRVLRLGQRLWEEEGRAGPGPRSVLRLGSPKCAAFSGPRGAAAEWRAVEGR
ncbi:MAG TPA: deoxyribonuclease IV, partial [Acidimicrobiales bacterium]|nr:deoxyribonuclease IV [Acidimicrobiales bacterium]